MELVAEATSPGVTGEQSPSGHEVAAGGDARLASGHAEWKRLPHRARYLTRRSLRSDTQLCVPSAPIADCSSD